MNKQYLKIVHDSKDQKMIGCLCCNRIIKVTTENRNFCPICGANYETGEKTTRETNWRHAMQCTMCGEYQSVENQYCCNCGLKFMSGEQLPF